MSESAGEESSPAVSPDTANRAAVAAVEAARARLDDISQIPVAGHVAVFDQVHDVLQSTLAGLDDR